MSSLLWHTIADMSGNWTTIFDEGKSDLYKLTFNYDYHLRGVDAAVEKQLWNGLWPAPRAMQGDPTTSLVPFGQDCNDSPGLFERPSFSFGGAARYSFCMGQILDPNGNPLASVALSLFLASNPPVFCSNGTSDANGNYQLPTQFAGQNHFIYATYNAGQYVGASVATLTPNF